MTSSLMFQQREFFSNVVDPLPEASAVPRLLKPTRASAAQQIAVYRRAYEARLVDCLRDDYPLVELTLGSHYFEALCRDFAQEFPPNTNSLNLFGGGFASWLKGKLQAEQLWVGDLARVEWALVLAIHADGSRVLTADTFSRIGPEQWARLKLQTSQTLCILELEYDIASYLSEPESQPPITSPAQQQSFLAICRRGNDLWRLPLQPWSASLMRQLRDGLGLGEALETLSAEPDSTPSDEAVFATFARWLEAGVFRDAVPY